MSQRENERFVRGFFEEARSRFTQLAGRFVDDPEAVVEQAATIFEGMISDMAYVGKPDHPMASAVFGCGASLAVYLALRERGIDAHDFGSAMLTAIAKAPLPEPKPEPEQPRDERTPKERFAEFVAIAKASEENALPGEFAYEAVLGDRTEFDWGMNVKSCAICSLFSKYDAMDLVPYMCATDDVVSDRENQGLRRTGTIAVGADHCDFRYKRGGEPQHLSPQYPDRIRIAEDG